MQTLLAGYAAGSGELDMVEEDEEELLLQAQAEAAEEVSDFNLIEKGKPADHLIDGEPMDVQQEGAQPQEDGGMKPIAEASVPNTFIQSYFPNNNKLQAVVANGENSFSAADGLAIA